MEQVLGVRSSLPSREVGFYTVAEICEIRGQKPTAGNRSKVFQWLLDLGHEYVEAKWIKIQRFLKSVPVPAYGFKKHPPVDCPI